MSPPPSLPSLVDYLLELLQSFAGRFSSRLAHAISLLRENQVAASVAAVAGFAASIIIIWRLGGGGGGGRARGGGRVGSSSRGEASVGSRIAEGSPPSSSSSSQREEEERRRLVSGKRDGDGSSAAGPSAAATSSDAAVGQSSAVATSLTRAVLRGSGAAGASQPTLQATALAGSVRRQLAGARKVTCHMPGVLLQQKSPQELLEGATLLPCDVCEALLELAKQCDLYLLARVDDDASEVAILSALESGGIIGPQSSVNSNKVLFCSTDVGVVSFVRQLEADLHLDASFEVVNELKRFVKRIGFVVAPGGAVPLSGAGNVLSTPSLSAFFATA